MIRNQRVLEDQLRWVYTQFPCAAYAQDADMSLRNYEDFFYHAAFADQSDPISLWQAVHTQQIRLVQWLNQKNEVIMQGPNIDLKLSISDRIFINGSGQDNIPDGEIYTGPVENSVNGWVRFTYPGIKDGREVTGIELEFKDGRVTAARADKNEAFLQSTLDTDEGARFLGEFAIGTNPAIQRFTRNILFDEKIGGTIHLALGNGYPETGSLNRSAIHWDLICDMRQESQIVVDGDLFYRNGEFLL